MMITEYGYRTIRISGTSEYSAHLYVWVTADIW